MNNPHGPTAQHERRPDHDRKADAGCRPAGHFLVAGHASGRFGNTQAFHQLAEGVAIFGKNDAGRFGTEDGQARAFEGGGQIQRGLAAELNDDPVWALALAVAVDRFGRVTLPRVNDAADETAAAILSLMENQKLVAEGAGAVPVAAALFHKLPIEGKKVVCLISGGNIDVNILNRVITRGLVMSGRKANLTIALEDKPGQLERVAAIVSRCGSNVVSVLHDGSDPNMPISSCFLKLVLETRDHAQIEQIRQELTKEGFQLVAERV